LRACKLNSRRRNKRWKEWRKQRRSSRNKQKRACRRASSFARRTICIDPKAAVGGSKNNLSNSDSGYSRQFRIDSGLPVSHRNHNRFRACNIQRQRRQNRSQPCGNSKRLGNQCWCWSPSRIETPRRVDRSKSEFWVVTNPNSTPFRLMSE
jgi:hypothetical protein